MKKIKKNGKKEKVPDMDFLGKMTIKRKMVLIIMLVTSVALLIACGAFITYQWFSFRKRMVDNLTIHSQMLGENCTAALSFNDSGDAEQVLASLKGNKQISLAALYKSDGSLFAKFQREGFHLDKPPSEPQPDGCHFGKNKLTVFAPVILKNQQIGTVFIQSDLSELSAFIGESGIMLVLMIFLSSVIAYILSSRLQRLISAPVLQLKETASAVSKTKDYSIRAIRQSEDEVGLLTNEFNQMLEQIQIKDNDLAKSERNYREIFNASSDAILIHDADTGAILDINQTMLDLYGYTYDEAKNLKISDISSAEPPYTEEEAVRRVRAAVQQGTQLFEWTARKKNGEIFWVEVSLKSTEVDGHGRVLAVSRDITKRKKVEEELIKWGQIFENAGWGIVSAKAESKNMEIMNPAYAKMHGYSVQEFRGKPIADSFAPECRKDLPNFINIAHEKGHYTFESKHIRKDGTIFPVLIDVTVVKNEKEKPLFRVVNVQDITERKKMENEVQKIQRLESLGTLAGGIAHDFNNLLSGILGNISVAQMNMDDKKTVLEKLQISEKIVSQASQLSKQLLTFSKGGAPVKEAVNMGKLVKECAEFALTGSSVLLECNFEKNVLPAYVDKGQIRQVIQNLTINAKHAMPKGGTIKITCSYIHLKENNSHNLKEGDYIKTSLKDSGTGISPEHLTNIFDPYFTTKTTGHGLGLAVVHSVIKKHDGHITVTSKLGEGTTFEIYFPASKKTISEEEIKPAHTVTGKGKILAMDDEEFIRAILSKGLSKIGYEIETASCGEKAIDLYKRAMKSGNPFDIVTLDFTVKGGMGGKETIIELKKINPDVKAIAMTGYSTDSVMSHPEKYGFIAGVAKPCSPKELAVLINQILAS